MSKEFNIAKADKKQIIADYKKHKAELKAEKKAYQLKQDEIDKRMTPEQKKEIEARAKEIKAAKAKEEEEKESKAKADKVELANKLKGMTKEEKKAFLAKRKQEITAKRLNEYQTKSAAKNSKLDKLTEELQSRYDAGGRIHLFFHNLNCSKFCRFFSDGWLKFSIMHPTLAHLIYMVFFFIVFSEGVTIVQFLIMLFLPYAFQSLSGQAFVWPQITLWSWSSVGYDGATNMVWGLFNEPVVYGTDGQVLANGGLGNFIAFEIAVFVAQIINFPLQRNITYKSHGNPWYQAMWYFIGWVLISLLVNAIWGFVNPILLHYMDAQGAASALYALIKTFITGTISMVIFFFIFMIIFPSGAADTSKDVARQEVIAKYGLDKVSD